MTAKSSCSLLSCADLGCLQRAAHASQLYPAQKRARVGCRKEARGKGKREKEKGRGKGKRKARARQGQNNRREEKGQGGARWGKESEEKQK